MYLDLVSHPGDVQTMAAEKIFEREAIEPPHVSLVKERPGLQAFYQRLLAKVFPNGPSENWSSNLWDPSKHEHSASTQ